MAAMSITYLTELFNSSLEQMLVWYKDFQDRTERAFQIMNRRIDYIENRGPSDEQVERVLRKILAEKFSGVEGDSRITESNGGPASNVTYVKKDVQYRNPGVVHMDIDRIRVDPSAVPSEAWRRNLDQLTHDIQDYPRLEHEDD